MSRFSDIDPGDLDPDTGRPVAGYSSPSLDDSFHDGEMDVDDDPPGSAGWHTDRVQKWIAGGCSSWGLPEQSIAYCAKRAAGLSHKDASE